MYRLVFLCAVLCACASRLHQTYSLEEADILFETFITDHKRQYVDHHEKQMRFDIFKKTLVRINKLNEGEGGRQVFGINKFSDYTEEETKQLKGLSDPTENDYSCKTIKTDKDIPDARAPDAFDWRDKDVVSEVKEQLCGTCYAFSAAGNIEGQYALKTGKLLSLSAQQIVDCFKFKRGEGDGCDGGSPSGTLLNINEAGGIETESDYPYTANSKDICKFNASKVAVKLADCTSYSLKSQEKLKQLLYKNGPLSVVMDSTKLIDYTNRVLKNCFEFVDHAVLLIGYGTDPVDGDYWLLKNSWGADWGQEGGFFRIERGEGKSSCGLINDNMVSAVVA